MVPCHRLSPLAVWKFGHLTDLLCPPTPHTLRLHCDVAAPRYTMHAASFSSLMCCIACLHVLLASRSRTGRTTEPPSSAPASRWALEPRFRGSELVGSSPRGWMPPLRAWRVVSGSIPDRVAVETKADDTRWQQGEHMHTACHTAPTAAHASLLPAMPVLAN